MNTVLIAWGTHAEWRACTYVRQLAPDARRSLTWLTLRSPSWTGSADVDVRLAHASDFISAQDGEELDQIIDSLCRSWFRDILPGTPDVTEWKGISFGPACTFHLKYLMLPAAKAAVVFHRFAHQLLGCRVVLATDFLHTRRLVESQAAELGCSVEYLDPPSPGEWRGPLAYEFSHEPQTGVSPSNAKSPRRSLSCLAGLIWELYARVAAALGHPQKCYLVDWLALPHQLARSHPLAKQQAILLAPALAPQLHRGEATLSYIRGRPWGLVRGRVPTITKRRRQAIWKDAQWHFQQRWAMLKERDDFQRRFALFGASFWPAIEPMLGHLFTAVFPGLAAKSVGLEAVLRRHNVQAVVTTQFHEAESWAMVAAARKQGIPSIYHPHGTLDALPLGRFTDILALWGTGDRDAFIAGGDANPPIVPVGGLSLDRLVEPVPTKRTRDLGAQLGIKAGRQILLYADAPEYDDWRPTSTYSADHEETLLRTVVQTVQDRADLQLIVKIHPHSSPVVAQGVLESMRFRGAVVVQGPLDPALLHLATIVVGCCTTVCLEAMVIGKPTIALNEPGARYIAPYAVRQAVLRATTPLELSRCIDMLLSDPVSRAEYLERAERFLDEYVGPRDGCSWLRLADLVLRASGAQGSVGAERATDHLDDVI